MCEGGGGGGGGPPKVTGGDMMGREGASKAWES